MTDTPTPALFITAPPTWEQAAIAVASAAATAATSAIPTGWIGALMAGGVAAGIKAIAEIQLILGSHPNPTPGMISANIALTVASTSLAAASKTQAAGGTPSAVVQAAEAAAIPAAESAGEEVIESALGLKGAPSAVDQHGTKDNRPTMIGK